jgi:molybdopterin-guanine dinucleotide biosynthesis protein
MVVPVTVITGFLGSGKTTLVNRLLKEQHGMRIAVIENEFGEVGVDDGLVVQANEEIFEMNNGCICCTVRGDLIRILHKLLKRKHAFDAILIETTGLADPAPVAQTFFVDDELKERVRLDAIVTGALPTRASASSCLSRAPEHGMMLTCTLPLASKHHNHAAPPQWWTLPTSCSIWMTPRLRRGRRTRYVLVQLC